MAYSAIQWAKQSTAGRQRPGDGSRLINFYPVVVASPQPDRKTPIMLYSVPGLRRLWKVVKGRDDRSITGQLSPPYSAVSEVHCLAYVNRVGELPLLFGLADRNKYFYLRPHFSAADTPQRKEQYGLEHLIRPEGIKGLDALNVSFPSGEDVLSSAISPRLSEGFLVWGLGGTLPDFGVDRDDQGGIWEWTHVGADAPARYLRLPENRQAKYAVGENYIVFLGGAGHEENDLQKIFGSVWAFQIDDPLPSYYPTSALGTILDSNRVSRVLDQNGDAFSLDSIFSSIDHVPDEFVDVAWIDGYFFVATRYGFLYHSRLDSIVFDVSRDFERASTKPDGIVGLAVYQRHLYVFGTRSVEVWYNAGNQAFAFNRDNSFSYEIGCASGDTIQVNPNGIFFLSDQGIVFQRTREGMIRLSKDNIEYDIQRSNMQLARGYAYTEEGHWFYILILTFYDGTTKTWAFDQVTNSWHERSITKFLSATTPIGDGENEQRPQEIGTLAGITRVDESNLAIFQGDPNIYHQSLRWGAYHWGGVVGRSGRPSATRYTRYNADGLLKSRAVLNEGLAGVADEGFKAYSTPIERTAISPVIHANQQRMVIDSFNIDADTRGDANALTDAIEWDADPNQQETFAGDEFEAAVLEDKQPPDREDSWKPLGVRRFFEEDPTYRRVADDTLALPYTPQTGLFEIFDWSDLSGQEGVVWSRLLEPTVLHQGLFIIFVVHEPEGGAMDVALGFNVLQVGMVLWLSQETLDVSIRAFRYTDAEWEAETQRVTLDFRRQVPLPPGMDIASRLHLDSDVAFTGLITNPGTDVDGGVSLDENDPVVQKMLEGIQAWYSNNPGFNPPTIELDIALVRRAAGWQNNLDESRIERPDFEWPEASAARDPVFDRGAVPGQEKYLIKMHKESGIVRSEWRLFTPGEELFKGGTLAEFSSPGAETTHHIGTFGRSPTPKPGETDFFYMLWAGQDGLADHVLKIDVDQQGRFSFSDANRIHACQGIGATFVDMAIIGDEAWILFHSDALPGNAGATHFCVRHLTTDEERVFELPDVLWGSAFGVVAYRSGGEDLLQIQTALPVEPVDAHPNNVRYYTVTHLPSPSISEAAPRQRWVMPYLLTRSGGGGRFESFYDPALDRFLSLDSDDDRLGTGYDWVSGRYLVFDPSTGFRALSVVDALQFNPNTADIDTLVQKDYKWSVLGQSQTQKHLRLKTKTKHSITIQGAYISGRVMDDEPGGG